MAQRQQVEGIAYELEHEWLGQLEASFPFRETDDQERAIEAVEERPTSPAAEPPAPASPANVPAARPAPDEPPALRWE